MEQQLERLRAGVAINGMDNVKLLGDIATTLTEMKDDSGLALGGGGAGGTFAGGRPIIQGNQSRRPTTGPTGYPGGTGYGMNITPGMGGLFGMAQQLIADRINTRSDSSGRAGGLHQDDILDYKPKKMTDGTTQYIPLHRDDQAANGVREGTPISEQTFRERARVSERAMSIGASRNIGGVIKSAVGEMSTGAKVAGGVATGVLAVGEAAYKYGQFIGNQRAANAQYQAIYGPGTSGWDQRVHNFGYRFGNFMNNLGAGFGIGDGGLSDSDADKAFKGLSAMGFQGGDRNNMLAWTRGNFNRLGMSVDQTLQLIGINAKEASTNFSELGNQLQAVSKMAQQTGQSAEVFRQAFVNSYGAAVSAGFAGSSAAVASAQVASTIGQGRLFAGLDTSAMYSTIGAQQVLANREGYGSVLDFTLAGQANPMVIANAQQRQLNQVFLTVVPPDVRAMIEAAIKRRGGAQNVATNQNAALSVVNDVEHQRPGAMNALAIQSAMMAAGIAGADKLDATALAIYYVQWVAKQGRNFTNPTAKAIAADAQRVGPAAGNILQHLHDHNAFGYRINAQGQAVYDPVIGHMESDAIGLVKVDTRQGPQVVSLQTAAEHYRGQLTSGSAVIMSGTNTGQTVGTVYGKEMNAHYRDTSRAKAQGSAFDAETWKMIKGLNLTDTQISQLADYSKQNPLAGSSPLGNNDPFVQSLRGKAAAMAHDNQGGALNGTITVGLRPDVAKYLEITTTGDSLVNRAAAAGGPPVLRTNGSSTGR